MTNSHGRRPQAAAPRAIMELDGELARLTTATSPTSVGTLFFFSFSDQTTTTETEPAVRPLLVVVDDGRRPVICRAAFSPELRKRARLALDGSADWRLALRRCSFL
jgi:hypothetical protein